MSASTVSCSANLTDSLTVCVCLTSLPPPTPTPHPHPHHPQALGQQPYTAESQLEAFGGAGPSAASRSAAGAMSAALGPTTASFAVHTLGKMHGMGAGKAWVSAGGVGGASREWAVGQDVGVEGMGRGG